MAQILEKPKHTRIDGWLCELWTYGDFHKQDFDLNHSYLVSIESKGIRARHYHNKKTELIACIEGLVEVILEDINTKKKERIILNSDIEKMKLLLIEPKIAHAIKNPTEKISKIVVFSNSRNLDDLVNWEFKEV